MSIALRLKDHTF